MKIISVINYKGGVGKTTVTSNLAGELAWRGYNVLLLDMDAQASLTFSFVSPDYWDNYLEEAKTIKNWFDCISQSEKPMHLADLLDTPAKVNQALKDRGGQIDIIASHLGLINVDLELATLLGGTNLTQSKKNYIKVHGKLRAALLELGVDNSYDIILVDCPPNFNIVTKNAVIASDLILVPAKPDYLSTLGIDYLTRSVDSLVREFNEYANLDKDTAPTTPEVLGVVFTMIQVRSGKPIAAQQQYISQTVRLGVPSFTNRFRENKTIFADAPQNGLPVVLHSYSGSTYTEIVSEIEAFVNEFQRKAEV
ncbi:cobyrinic acid a,c-diamide synthase [Thiohalocapsa halophila]|uniref:Cobyrinic acid a,c-diamide synthase n=1 Tax=Thiohalocapsa halophila TaxID=69359 RepID=A0ABS1CPA0_9GAMM|nr:AAA family ATPase [Thiohalocapsa halophila]MBK1633674.1 cobyrinic acid a,c-diamide synthase [Thiohalocapsa halophila]